MSILLLIYGMVYGISSKRMTNMQNIARLFIRKADLFNIQSMYDYA